ncbi:nuclear transcription factor Y subunit gamma isoform X1, partial [Paramuricea clavata]
PGSVQTEAHQLLASFWTRKSQEIRTMTDFKTQELPLARIKKIMKQDEEVKMISAEAPVLFAKAAEIFINELSLRAWVHTEDNKRRTLQRNDIAMAITKYDMFDFLIDIVPRDDLKPNKRQEAMRHTIMAPQDQVQYYFQLAHQYQPQQPHAVQTAPTQAQPIQVGTQQQTAIIGAIAQPQQGAVVVTMASGQPQLIQTQPHDQNEVTYQIPFTNMPYINRIQQMASVQQLQQQQQQTQQQGQQPTQAVTVQVQGSVSSQPQIAQAQQQTNAQAQQVQGGQVQVGTQEAQPQANPQSD